MYNLRSEAILIIYNFYRERVKEGILKMCEHFNDVNFHRWQSGQML